MLKKLINTNTSKLSKIMAICVFVLILMFYGNTIRNINIMDKQMTTVTEHPYVVVVTTGDIKANLNLLRALPERLTYSNSPEMIEGISEHYNLMNNEISNDVDVLLERYLADTVNAPALKQEYELLKIEQDKLLDLAKTPGITSEELSDFYVLNLVPKLDELDILVENIVDGAGRKMSEYSNTVSEARNNMLLMGTALSAAVIIAMIFYLYLLQHREKEEQEMNRIKTELEVEQRSNAAKSQFLFNMSHDIRTPMNAIIGLTAIAAMDIDKKDKVKECLTKISSSSRQLLGLINDVLDMSRIESGKVSLNEDEFILSDLINDFISITQPQASSRNIKFEVRVIDLLHERVVADPIQIKRILVNIVGNSLKFTPTGGQILVTIKEISATAKGYGNFEFKVEDTGLGMSESFLEKIFLPFERAETSTKSKVEGTGLGMAITKNTVDMMGGQIIVESKLDKGTKFTVTLPLKLQEIELESYDFSSLHDLKSLVVDDDIILCENTSRMLENIGMKCEWVLTGNEAVEKTKLAQEINRQYHVVIVDWHMPGMDGVETTRKIREIVGEELPIIVLTAYDWVDIEDEAKAAGVNAFLAKPVFKSTLYHLMYDLTSPKSNDEPMQEEAKEEQKFTGKILLVEDNEINMEIAEEFIQYFGVNPDKAWDGLEALEIIKSHEPGYYDLIFMDIQMPQLDGYETTRRIRKDEEEMNTVHVPIVAMSANAFVEEINKGYACGMDNYITKPVEIETLQKTIQQYLSKDRKQM